MIIEQILNLDKDEIILKEIKRHPVGLWGLYIFGIGSIFLLLGLLYWVLHSNSGNFVELSDAGYVGLFGFLIMLFALFTFVGIHVYTRNELVITNENIIQILQFGLFNRQISQLNLAKVQDVSVDQAGILSTFFGYGTLEIETAGEAANFKFRYAPTPNICAKIIIEAHENYVTNENPTGDGT
jgi:uncharacterized membrane protein YdbT with pleckstrin-like domain